MASVGRLDEFDPKSARWTTCKLRLESWLRANKVTQAQAKLDYFIAIVGCKTVELVEVFVRLYRSLTNPMRIS